MKISSKPAILGKSFKVHNVRARSEDGEEGGDAGELIAARDIPLKKIMVTKSQFNKLIGSDQAYNSFFNDGTKPPEPAFESIDALKLKESYRDCSAVLMFGVSSKTIEIEGDAKIKNIRLKPCVGGVAEMSCTLQAPLPRKLETLDLEQFIGKEINVTLKFGPVDEGEDDKQNSLPLEGKDGDEDSADDSGSEEADEKPRRRRAPAEPRVN